MNSHLKLKNRIKELRQEKGYSQTKLAELAGTTQNTISSLKIGAGYNARGVVSLVGMSGFITWYETKRGKIVYGKRIIRYFSR